MTTQDNQTEILFPVRSKADKAQIVSILGDHILFHLLQIFGFLGMSYPKYAVLKKVVMMPFVVPKIPTTPTEGTRSILDGFTSIQDLLLTELEVGHAALVQITATDTKDSAHMLVYKLGNKLPSEEDPADVLVVLQPDNHDRDRILRHCWKDRMNDPEYNIRTPGLLNLTLRQVYWDLSKDSPDGRRTKAIYGAIEAVINEYLKIHKLDGLAFSDPPSPRPSRNYESLDVPVHREDSWRGSRDSRRAANARDRDREYDPYKILEVLEIQPGELKKMLQEVKHLMNYYNHDDCRLTHTEVQFLTLAIGQAETLAGRVSEYGEDSSRGEAAQEIIRVDARVYNGLEYMVRFIERVDRLIEATKEFAPNALSFGHPARVLKELRTGMTRLDESFDYRHNHIGDERGHRPWGRF